MPTPEQRQAMIDRIAALPAQLQELVSPLSERQLATHFLAHEWTVAQNVHHLADSHMSALMRLKLILTEDRPRLKGYDQDRYAELADGGHLQIEESLRLLSGLHRRWVRLLESLEPRQWARVGVHDEYGETSVDDQLATYAAHGEGHLDQIARTLAADTQASTR
jgi:hypothetical protein